VRWGGTLFAEGMLSSISRSLTDCPALLLIAIGMRLLERNRERLGAAVLAAAGLVRETSVFCAAALLSPGGEPPGWGRRLVEAAAVVLPTLIWTSVLVVYHGEVGSYRNFDLPFASVVQYLGTIRDAWPGRGALWVGLALCGIVAMSVQVGFVMARPKLGNAWWRIGAAFSILWLCLGWAVWEVGHLPHAAAPRVILPLTLAFNVLVPRTGLGLVLLLAGNADVLPAMTLLKPPPLLE
jgi:hypothetical protein